MVGSFATAAPASALAVPPHQLHSVHLPASSVYPGSVLVAFRAPVSVSGARINTTADGARRAGLPPASVATETDRVNNVLAGLHATSVQRLFTNIPAAKLQAARERAMRATGRYLTDLTQTYLVRFSPSLNDGAAANRLQTSGLVWTATPNFKLQKPMHEAASPISRPGAAPVSGSSSSAAGLPPNYSYATDGQSYHDAASNNVTGAFVDLQKKFGQQPAQGETITNISLGDIDNNSTVLENGQRFLEQRGLPKIPTFISHLNCPPADPTKCTAELDPAGTNSGQGDLTEVLLDFSTMAPPPRGDPRVPNPQTPGQLGEILGDAYGANFRLINPLNNSTNDFLAALVGAGFLQTPAPSVITASIGNSLPPGEFPDDEFEAQTAIRDIIAVLTEGQDIFVTTSSGDGQTFEGAAGPPNGTSGPYNLAPAGFEAPDLDSFNPADPDYTYLWTSETRLLPDSGANSSGGTTLNDVFNNSPNNTAIPSLQQHTQTTTETRWTGQQNFHTGTGDKLSVAAPADDVLFLAQVEDANGIPVDPVSVEPELIGGTSASSPEIAGAAAVVRQAARLAGVPLSAVQTRDLLAATGHDNVSPTFDLLDAPIG
ncbi:MAG TPA: S8 family serine peptidase, partial [Mycobacterium sp.]|nr:S8 family serine peptidase [Mycobacterium sp.]